MDVSNEATVVVDRGREGNGAGHFIPKGMGGVTGAFVRQSLVSRFGVPSTGLLAF